MIVAVNSLAATTLEEVRLNLIKTVSVHTYNFVLRLFALYNPVTYDESAYARNLSLINKPNAIRWQSFFFFAILSFIAKFCRANTETSSDQASRSSNEVFLEVHFCNLLFSL